MSTYPLCINSSLDHRRAPFWPAQRLLIPRYRVPRFVPPLALFVSFRFSMFSHLQSVYNALLNSATGCDFALWRVILAARNIIDKWLEMQGRGKGMFRS